MQQKSALFVSLLCIFFLGITNVTAQTLQLQIYSSSNNWWLAGTAVDGGATTVTIEIQESGSSTWMQMAPPVSGWDYWSYNAPNSNTGFNFPLSFRLTSGSGSVVTFLNVVTNFTGDAQVIDSGVKYTTSYSTSSTSYSSTPTFSPAPTDAPTEAAATEAPTDAPTQAATEAATQAATDAPTQAATEAATQAATEAATQAATEAATQAATEAATQAATEAATQAATEAATQAATVAPTQAATQAATEAADPTAAPASTDECSANIKLLVPLYVYPGSTWDTVAAGASSVETVAIINPNSGPASSPDASYTTYMQKLDDAGVVMIGYVHTSYGARSIADVKADIATWATEYPLISGIFLDEAASSSDMVTYYETLYEYIMSMPGWSIDIVNPGTIPDSGYLSVSTNIVSLEDAGSTASSVSTPSYGSCSNKDSFSAIVHTVDSSSMESVVDALFDKAYFGYVYVTDGAGGCCTYNTLSSYYSTLVSYIASKN